MMDQIGNNSIKTLTFVFTKDEAQIILDALLKEQCGKVLYVVNKLQSQASEQMKVIEPTKGDNTP